MKLKLASAVLLLCVGSVFAAEPTERHASFLEGLTAYKAGEYQAAIDAWRVGAYEGVAEAQYNLGVMYVEGRGVEKNPEAAHRWFVKAAQQNHTEALYNLGHMYAQGIGTKKRLIKARQTWGKAAANGYELAQYNYGKALLEGIGGKTDIKSAYYWLDKARTSGNNRAEKLLESNRKQFAKLVNHKFRPEQELLKASAAVIKNDSVVSGPEIAKPIVKQPVAAPTFAKKTVPADKKKSVTYVTEPAVKKVIAKKPKLDIRQRKKVSTTAKEVDRQTKNSNVVYVKTKATNYQFYESAAATKASGLIQASQLFQVLEVKGNRIQVQGPAGETLWLAQSATMSSTDPKELLAQEWQRKLGKSSILTTFNNQAVQEKPVSLPPPVINDKPKATNKVVIEEIFVQNPNARKAIVSKNADTKAFVDTTAALEKAMPRVLQPVTETVVTPTIQPTTQAVQARIQTPDNVSDSGRGDDHSWLFNQVAGRYSLLLFTLSKQDKLDQVLADSELQDVHLFTTPIAGKTWYYFLEGSFASIDEAEQRKAQLPKRYSDAVVRSLDKVRTNRCQELERFSNKQQAELINYCRL